LKLADYVVTERASARISAPKVLRHQVPEGWPEADLTVIVATIRALKMHGASRRMI